MSTNHSEEWKTSQQISRWGGGWKAVGSRSLALWLVNLFVFWLQLLPPRTLSLAVAHFCSLSCCW